MHITFPKQFIYFPYILLIDIAYLRVPNQYVTCSMHENLTCIVFFPSPMCKVEYVKKKMMFKGLSFSQTIKKIAKKSSHFLKGLICKNKR